MNTYTLFRKKVPPTLRVHVITPRSLGDKPIAKITKPSNLTQPKNVLKTAACQYEIVFDASCNGETVDVQLSASESFVAAFLKMFTWAFWWGLVPGRNFWTFTGLKIFLIRSIMVTGIFFICLVGLELYGVKTHTPLSNWLNTQTMAENAADKIKEIVGWDEQSPFFQSQEAINFHTRTGKELDKVYLVMSVINGAETYKMLVRKNFLPADDLDSAEDICEKELDAEIPSIANYRLFMGSDIKSDLDRAFAEWTSDSKGLTSDDYRLYLPPEYVATWQISVAEIKASDSAGLNEQGAAYGLQRNGMDDDDFKKDIIKRLNEQLRLPAETDIEYDEGMASFFLDADSEANFRCVRRLESTAVSAN